MAEQQPHFVTAHVFNIHVQECSSSADKLFYSSIESLIPILGEVGIMVSKDDALNAKSNTENPIMDRSTRGILIALADISGWSAERISVNVKDKLKLNILPEHIYQLHQDYVAVSTVEDIEKNKAKMKIFLESKGFPLLTYGRPMSELLGKAPVRAHHRSCFKGP
ncbi:hypothetical protein BDZ45DRAFT_169136 [Acephala macrosclerotiorum]|nr:hypothetical protein BDZ45DRAFT_169136 [Acephala macrosclerotiorum]